MFVFSFNVLSMNPLILILSTQKKVAIQNTLFNPMVYEGKPDNILRPTNTTQCNLISVVNM